MVTRSRDFKLTKKEEAELVAVTRALKPIPPRPPTFEVALLEEGNVFLAMQRWLHSRPLCTLELKRDDTNSFWVCKAGYRQAFLMAPDEVLEGAIREATARIERLCDRG